MQYTKNIRHESKHNVVLFKAQTPWERPTKIESKMYIT